MPMPTSIGVMFTLIDFDEAIADYTKATEFIPNFAKAYNNRGNAYAKKGILPIAVLDYTKAIESKPDYAGAYNNRGNVYARQRDFNQAITDYTKAIRLKPDYAKAYLNRGNVYARTPALFDRALTDYTKAIDLKRGYSEAYYKRGILRLRWQEWRKARADLRDATGLDFDIVAAFREEHESVEAFEAKYGVEVPEDLAAMLRGPSD